MTEPTELETRTEVTVRGMREYRAELKTDGRRIMYCRSVLAIPPDWVAQTRSQSQ